MTGKENHVQLGVQKTLCTVQGMVQVCLVTRQVSLVLLITSKIVKYSHTSTRRGNEDVDKSRWLCPFHLGSGKGRKSQSSRSAGISKSPGGDTAFHICQCRKAVTRCLGYSEWIHTSTLSTLCPKLQLDQPSNLTPTALLGSLTIQLSCETSAQRDTGETWSKQSCHSRKQQTARPGLEERWLAKTALPVLTNPAHLEKRRNCLCPAHHNLLPFQSPSSVYKHVWRLLKGNRSQGVKEIRIANQFVLRCQHRSS